MRVLLVRHGEAVSPDVARDAERWLTERGRAITHAVAEALRPTVTVGHIFTSPLVRAVQTADLLASGLGFSGAVEAFAPLAAGTTAQMAAALDRVPSDATVMLVGHEPSIRVLAAHLAGVPALGAFAPATVCAVDRKDGHGKGAWILDPDTRTQQPFR